MDALLSSMEGKLRDLEEMEAALRSDPGTSPRLGSMTESVINMAVGRHELEALKALLQNPHYRTIDQITGNKLHPEDMTPAKLMGSFEEGRPDGRRTMTKAPRTA